MNNKIKEEKKYLRKKIEYYHNVRRLKIDCKLCGCIVEKCSLRLHHKSNKCNRLRETFKSIDIQNENENDNENKIKNENAIKKLKRTKNTNASTN